MKKLLLLLLFIPILLIPVYAQENSDNIPTKINLKIITIDKTSYSSGDIIKITGSVSPLAEYSQIVTILIVSPNGNLVSISQVLPNTNGIFSTTIKAGSSMTVSGDYEIRAQYGAQKITNTFVFIAGESENVLPQLTNSSCGAGTIFDKESNSCILIPSIPTQEPELAERDQQKFEKKIKEEESIQMDIQNTEEITQLKEQFKNLKLENHQLKLQIIDLQNQVIELEQDLENLMKQFIYDIGQITGWIQ